MVRVLDGATAGTKFLFGRLALPPGTRNDMGEKLLGFFLAFQALPTVVFFTSLVKSYQDLAAALASLSIHNPRSAILATYALYGFAHIPSLAIFVGGTAALAPTRAGDLSRVGFRALLAATLACLMTAAVAGTFFIQGSILLGK